MLARYLTNCLLELKIFYTFGAFGDKDKLIKNYLFKKAPFRQTDIGRRFAIDDSVIVLLVMLLVDTVQYVDV